MVEASVLTRASRRNRAKSYIRRCLRDRYYAHFSHFTCRSVPNKTVEECAVVLLYDTLHVPHKVVEEEANGSVKFGDSEETMYLFNPDIYINGRILVQGTEFYFRHRLRRV